jgi:hypothetical protein
MAKILREVCMHGSEPNASDFKKARVKQGGRSALGTAAATLLG